MSSGALDDAAPEPVEPESPEEDSIAPVSTGPSAPPALVPVPDPRPPEPPALEDEPGPRLSLVPDLEPDTEPDPEFEPDPEAATEPGTEADLDLDAAVEAEAPESDAVRADIFVPERPRRELLTLDKPEPPRPAGTGRDEMMPHPEDPDLDIAGSPRAALRDAGLGVPKMHQLVRRPQSTMWAFGVRASDALGWWLEIRQAAEKTGWMPVLLGAPEEWRDSGEAIIHEGDDELSRAESIDAEELLHDKAAEAGEPARGVPILPRRGDTDFATPQQDGLLGLVEADAGWKIPAMFPWKGSTNWELYGAEHAAILGSWHRRFEAEVVAMTYDVLELYVPRPPSPEEALGIAAEVYAYCPDLLDSGVPTLEDLAEHMILSKAWYFRWT